MRFSVLSAASLAAMFAAGSALATEELAFDEPMEASPAISSINSGAHSAADFLDHQTQAAVNALIREYLVNNTGEVLDLLQEHVATAEAMEREKQVAAYEQAAADLREDLLDHGTATVFGSEDAAVSIVYFQDFNCVYCQSMSESVTEALEIEGVQVINRYLPILNESSVSAAVMAVAADRVAPHALPAIHQDFYEQAGSMDYEAQMEVLEAHLSTEELNRAANYISDEGGHHEEVFDLIETNLDLANEIGVRGTPFFVVFTEDSQQAYPGAMSKENFLSIVNAALSN